MNKMDIFDNNKNKVVYEAYVGSLGDSAFIRKLEDVEINDELAKTLAEELGMDKPTEFFKNSGAQDGIEYSVFNKQHDIKKLYFREVPTKGLKVDLINRDTDEVIIGTTVTEYLSVLDLQRLLFQINNNIKFVKFENKTDDSKLIMILTAELDEKELEYQVKLEWDEIPVVIDKLDSGRVSASSKFFRVKARGNADRVFLISDMTDKTSTVVCRSIVEAINSIKSENNSEIKGIVRREVQK